MITNFINNNTVITADWLNKIDRAVSEAIGSGTDSPTTPTQVKQNIGLANVDNTSDLNKPISTATQAALTTLVPRDSVTGAASIPTGTTAQRPVSPTQGMFRRNSQLSQWEGYNGTSWDVLADTGSVVTLTGTQTLQNKTLDGTNSLSGNLSLTGTGARITGDFSNATVANRVMFQTSTAGSATSVAAIPNGGGFGSAFVALSTSDPANAVIAVMEAVAGGAEVKFNSTRSGSAPFAPMTFYTGGSERMRIDTSGYVKSISNAKAWVNFNGTLSGTITPRANLNIASVTKNGTGDYTLNIAAGVLTDANYSVVLSVGSNSTSDAWCPQVRADSLTTTAARVYVKGTGTTFFDTAMINATIFGN